MLTLITEGKWLGHVAYRVFGDQNSSVVVKLDYGFFIADTQGQTIGGYFAIFNVSSHTMVPKQGAVALDTWDPNFAKQYTLARPLHQSELSEWPGRLYALQHPRSPANLRAHRNLRAMILSDLESALFEPSQE